MKKWIIIGLTVISASMGFTQQLTIGAPSSPRFQANQILQEADYILMTGNLQEAIIKYTTAINMDLGYAESYMKRAKALHLLGDVSGAMKDYDRAIELNPYSEVIFDRRAALKIIAKDYKGAIMDQNDALYLRPDNDVIRSNRLDTFIAMGEYDKALSEIDTLIAHGFELEHEFEKQALVRFRDNDFLGAEESVAKALDVNPYSSIAHDVKGLLLMKKGEFEQAIESFTTAITYNAQFALAHYNRAVAYKHLGKAALAMKDLDEAISISNEIPNVYFARALVKKQLGDFEGAIEDYNNAQVGDSVYTKALFNRSYTYQLMGDPVNAMSDAMRILDIKDDEPSVWKLKGNIHVMFGDYDDAILAYNEAIRLDPDYALAYYNRGIAYHMSYRIIEGCQDLEQARDLGYEKSAEAYKYFCGF